MSKKPKIRAAGTVVFREKNGKRQVLLVHRPAYSDWTLPKGKPKPDEDLAVAAVRETYEESGVRVRLGVRLTPIKYRVPKGEKKVQYWVGQLLSQKQRKPDKEVDQVKWFDLEDARKKLTYSDEINVLDEAVYRNGHTVSILIVRHGKAMERKHWTGPDQNRTLGARGKRQSERLIDLLGAYGVTRVISSSSKRCVLTVKPYCADRALPLEKVDLLTEEEAEGNDEAVTRYIHEVAYSADSPVAFCGHRPVLPAMLHGVGIEPRPMLTGEVIAVHLRGDEVVSFDVHKNAF